MFSSKQKYYSEYRLFPQIILNEEKLPYLHPKISLAHLHDNGKLFTDDEINFILAFFRNNSELSRVKTSAQNGNFYSIIPFYSPKENKVYYCALYLGKKHDKHLGAGAYGKVKLMQDIETGKWLALKIENELKKSDIDFFENEYEILSLFNQTMGRRERLQENSPPQYLLAMQLLRGVDLDSFLRCDPHLPMSVWIQIAINICQAVYEFEYKNLDLNSNPDKTTTLNLLHNDIKTTNIFINPVTLEINLLDFQFTSSGPRARRGTPLGSAGYMALELKISKKAYEYNEKTEVHTLGITLAELFGAIFASRKLGQEVYKTPVRYRVYDATARNELRYSVFDPETPEISIMERLPDKSLRDEITQFLLSMTHDVPSYRPSIGQVLQFFKSLQEELLAENNYTKKIGILNIDEYLNQTEQEQKALHLMLKEMDEVWFIDTKKRNLMEYLCLQRTLEAENIKLGERIFYPAHDNISPQEMFEQIRSDMLRTPLNLAYQQRYHFISRTNQAKVEETNRLGTDNNMQNITTLDTLSTATPEDKLKFFQKPQA